MFVDVIILMVHFYTDLIKKKLRFKPFKKPITSGRIKLDLAKFKGFCMQVQWQFATNLSLLRQC